MRPETLPIDWGTWVLGDLSDVLWRVVKVLGPSASITTARITPPAEGQPLPEVCLEVCDPDESAHLRGEASLCEFVADFDADYGDPGWARRVAGLRLRVTVQEVP